VTAEELVESAREVFAGREAWIVGGAVRDRLLGRATVDLDLSLPDDPRDAARELARTTGGAAFRLSGAFGAWRVVGPDHAWHVDLVVLRDGDIAADLAARDFTINAMAEPLAGGDLLDPHGGQADIEARRLRMVSAGALADDPLRTLRAVRIAVDLDLTIEPETAAAIGREAPGLERVAAERIFGELKHIVRSPAIRTGLRLMELHGITAQVLPELLALRGVEQNEFHHLDVHDHTLEVVDQVSAIERDPLGAGFGEHADAVGALLREPLGDELSRGDGMRLAALLHDAAKPWTRTERSAGDRIRVGFPGHDREGAQLARTVLRRLRASERLVQYVAALCLHHLRLGFLVHQRPLDRRDLWRYLEATDPYAAEVTIFTVADRLATRGRNAEPAIVAHLELARQVFGPALARRAEGRPRPLLRGDELARELGIPLGRRLGELLAQLEEDRFAGAITTREDALRRARELAG
jgi:poly(A) polymerase